MWQDHVLNRGNRREAVFHKAADYDAFVKAMSDATAAPSVDILVRAPVFYRAGK